MQFVTIRRDLSSSVSSASQQPNRKIKANQRNKNLNMPFSICYLSTFTFLLHTATIQVVICCFGTQNTTLVATFATLIYVFRLYCIFTLLRMGKSAD
jgi:hypothetical protein